MRTIPILLFLFWVSAVTSTSAAENGNGFLVFPVETELQRSILGSTMIAYCVINGDSVLDGTMIDAAAIDLSALRKQLTSIANGANGDIAISLRSCHRQAKLPAEQLVQAAISDICHRAGFNKVSISTQTANLSWEENLSAINRQETLKPDRAEAVLRDVNVRVSTVQTRLSRWLTGNCDCVVFVRHSIDGRTAGLPHEVCESIRKCVSLLEIPQKGRLGFYVSSTSAGEAVVKRFLEKNQDDKSTPAGIATSLGFDSNQITHSANHGAPEKLLGHKPPDFRLSGLDGKDIRLSALIRDRVCLITFWGVACGPCQQEAPSLSKLYDRYSDAGLVVIAVNAYDESYETVADYVKRTSLTYPIALGGRKVAVESYFVGAYPTSFFIDRSGNVTEYVVGFHAGDEIVIEGTIERLLNQLGK